MCPRHRILDVLALVLLLWWGGAAPAGAQETGETSSLRDAVALWRNGYVLHLAGAYQEAAKLFRKSIEAHPTAEGHTFLGWSLSKLGRLEDAIDECKKAIPLDPDYGNPYNDIGVYLIELGRLDQAVPWLEKAMTAERYCCYQFAHFNLGRVRLGQGREAEAQRAFERALAYEPNYLPARKGLEYIRAHWGRPL